MEELLCKFLGLFYDFDYAICNLDQATNLLIRRWRHDDSIEFLIMGSKTLIDKKHILSVRYSYAARTMFLISPKQGEIRLVKSRDTLLCRALFDPIIIKDYEEMDITQFNLTHKGTIKQISNFKEILEFVVENWHDDDIISR